MINRVLIRIKTVQLLYSYLLVNKPFALETQPEARTKEKRFAYNLYLDVIYLFYGIASRITNREKKYPLKKTRFILRIENDERFKSLKAQYASGHYPFAPIEAGLAEKVKDSLLYKNLVGGKDNESDSDKIWENIFNAIILPDPEFNDILKQLPSYSLSGVERMSTMLTETFSNFYATRENIDDALRTLASSMEKARELYIRLLALPVEITNLRKDQLELNRRKHLASVDDLNPSLRFVENVLPAMIEKDPVFSEYVESHHISWLAEDRELLENLLNEIMASDEYKSYMESGNATKVAQIDFWREIFKKIIFNSAAFLEYLENKSVFWNDDLEITGTFLLKTLKRFEDITSEEPAVLPMYKDHEDAVFGAELFRLVVENKEQYQLYINQALEKDKWETERLAFMDVVITMTALAEILNFPKVPLGVSINEYVEIAKSYSSSKSGSFVHGLLASLIANLKEEGDLNK